MQFPQFVFNVMISAYLMPLCSTDRTNTSNSMTLYQKQGTSPVKSCNFYLLSTMDLSYLNASYLHIVVPLQEKREEKLTLSFFECCANEYFKTYFKGIVARVSQNLKQFERGKLFSTGILQLI